MERTEPAITSSSTDGWLLAAGWMLAALVAFLMLGCESAPPIVETVVVEKPVPVPCRIPPVERPRFAVSQVSPADDMVTINRALRAELEQRRGYELKLEAGVKACQ